MSLKSSMEILSMTLLAKTAWLCSRRPLVILALCASSTSSLLAQAPRSRPPSPAIRIGGYSVALGSSIEQVNKSLGEVFVARLFDSGSWLYEQDGKTVAKIFIENGRVSEIVKYFDYSSADDDYSNSMLKEVKDATAEFKLLARGHACSRLTGEDRIARPDGALPGVELSQRCGPYLLSIDIVKYSSGQLGAHSAIVVTG